MAVMPRLWAPDWMSLSALPWLQEAIDWGRKKKPLWFEPVCNMETTDRPYEQYTSFTKFGLMAETDENASYYEDSALQGFDLTLTPLQYSLGFKVSRLAYDDDKLGVSRNLASGLGESDTETRNQLAAYILNNGTSSTLVPVADGAALFSTSHYREDGVTFRNRLATAADFNLTSWKTALTDFATQFKSGRGFFQNYVPRNILTHYSTWPDVAEVLGSQLKPDTANNNTNVYRDFFGAGDFNLLPPCAYLTDEDSVYLFADKADHGFTFLSREAFNTQSDVDFHTRALLTAAWTRYDIGVTNNGIGLYAMIGA